MDYKMVANKKGRFIVSLDFELLWGVHDHETKESFRESILGGREGVYKMLSLFDQYGIHVTWGIVGMLMSENREDMDIYSPKTKPSYQNSNLSSYNHFECLGNDETDDVYHYAYSLVQEILRHRNQEVASHTFSHYYCKEDGQTIDSFEEDLRAAKRISQDKFEVDLKSLILPRNQFDEDYVKRAFECGFQAVRGNPNHYAYNNQNLFSRMIRLIDTYVNICGKKGYCVEYSGDGIIDLKASVFYRSYKPNLSILEPLKIACIKKEMKKAARNGEIFHLWWHPHNIGKRTEKCLEQLRELFSYYNELNDVYGFESKNMKEMAEEIIHENSNVVWQR